MISIIKVLSKVDSQLSFYIDFDFSSYNDHNKYFTPIEFAECYLTFKELS